MKNNTKITIKTAAAMQKFGAKLAKLCKPGDVIYLIGDLGAGKTTLVRGLLRELGVTEHVRSPTFTLVEPYSVNFGTVYHFDLYRLVDAEEFYYIGGSDYFTAQSICLLEWPEHGGELVPKANLVCKIDFSQDGGRIIEVIYCSASNDENIFVLSGEHGDRMDSESLDGQPPIAPKLDRRITRNDDSIAYDSNKIEL